MKKFKVYALRAETLCAIIEADSAEEAEEAADKYYSNFDWSDVHRSQSTSILYGDSEEEEDDDE